MKFLILLGDGMSDYPVEELDGRTPLMAARTPNMDSLVAKGILGRVQTIPADFAPGSDVANLSVLGYDPNLFYTGRAPLEAASMKIPLGTEDVAFRCNLVTLSKEGGKTLMKDFSAGHITSDEARQVIQTIDQELGTTTFSFYPGVSYRHLMVWRQGTAEIDTTPPHDITGQEVSPYLPKGKGAEPILALMQKAEKVLDTHPTNRRRKERGEDPATAIWLWGQGGSLEIPSFETKYGCSGAVISAVDLIKGIGMLIGLESIDVPGATGFLDTNYRGKAEYAINALQEKDFVYVHVEAPDEAAHSGNVEHKIQAIEDFDAKVVGTVVKEITQFQDFRIMVLPDHATPTKLKTHASDPVPFVIYPAPAEMGPNGFETFDEASATGSELFFTKGHKLIDFFISKKRDL